MGPEYDETVVATPLHIECPSKEALTRRIEDVDKDAAFVWFSGVSEAQRRGAVMVYLPVAIGPTASRLVELGQSGAFYVGFSQREGRWEPAMLRGVRVVKLRIFKRAVELWPLNLRCRTAPEVAF
jgi:hypothetical protein